MYAVLRLLLVPTETYTVTAFENYVVDCLLPIGKGHRLLWDALVTWMVQLFQWQGHKEVWLRRTLCVGHLCP